MAFGAFQSYRLDQILEMGLLSLYENWDDLPRKSTKRYLRNLSDRLADQFEADATESVREDQILDFWKQAERLPKVGECAKESLGHLDRWVETKTMSGSVRPGVRSFSLTQVPDSDFSANRLHLLATLLRDEKPSFYVGIPYNIYQLPETFEALRKALQRSLSFGLLPREISSQVEQLLHEHTLREKAATTYRERCEAYLQAIEALNLMDQVQATMQGTLESYRKVKTHRGIPPSNPNGTIQHESPEAKGVNVNLHTNVKFPNAVKKHETEPLIVQFTLHKPDDSRITEEVSIEFADRDKPELIDVVVSASGFTEMTGIWSRKIEVYSYKNSQPAIFLLKGEVDGTQRITIDFYHHDRQLSSGDFQVEIYTGNPLSTFSPERTPFSVTYNTREFTITTRSRVTNYPRWG